MYTYNTSVTGYAISTININQEMLFTEKIRVDRANRTKQIYAISGFRFSQQCWWILKFSGIRHHAHL